MIRRSFQHLTVANFPKLFSAVIRSKLEYCAPACPPCTKKNKDLLEGVQRLGTRLVVNISKLSYEERLKAMDLYSLEYRRLRGDLITLYRTLRGELGGDLLNHFTFDHRSNRRGHSWKLINPTVDIFNRQLMFSVRVVSEWNKLPERVVSAPSTQCFKNRLDEIFTS